MSVPLGLASRWGDLGKRVVSAVVMVPVALGCVWVGGAAFAALVALLTIGMAAEWLRMCQARLGPRPVLMFAALPLAVFMAAVGQAASAFGVLAVVTVVASVRPGGPGSSRLLPLGVPYIGLGAVALVWLRAPLVLGLANPPATGRDDVIILLLVVWATDIGAYVVGRAVGGPRLAPRISPGKTWSGAAGGVLAGVAVGYFAAATLGAAEHRPLTAVLAGGIACVGQAGDLLESLLKRHFNVKDSGSLIPGHGGLLDRLDAVLVAAPAAGLLALLVGRGVSPWQ